MRILRLDSHGGRTSTVVWVDDPEDLGDAVVAIGIEPRPVVLVVGGAAGISESDAESLRPLFDEVIAPLIESLGAAAVDGGTDSGVMRLMGQGRATAGAGFPLVGVAAAGTVQVPGDSPVEGEMEDLEPNHTHFLLVPGDRWGDESPWLDRVTDCLADGRPSATILIDGGEIAEQDVARSVERGRPVVVLVGTGRLANELAAAVNGEPSRAQARQLASSGLIWAVDADQRAAELSETIRDLLSSE